MKTFINQLKHKGIELKDSVKDIHYFLSNTKQGDMYKIWKTEDRTLYSMFFGWLLENIWYGLLITISLIIFGINIKRYYPFVIACLYWLCLDTIDKITQTIRRIK